MPNHQKPPNILAIDTSSAVCSVALHANHHYYYATGSGKHQHTQQILPTIQQLLTEANTSLESLDALAFTSGPGSFTGIRLAASIIQGLAFGAKLPVITISTLQTIAQGMYETQHAQQIAVAIDAYGGKIYWGVYHLIADEMLPLCPNILCAPADACLPTTANDHWIGVGDGWKNYERSLSHLKVATIDTEQTAHAKYVLTLGTKAFIARKYVTPVEAVPIYLYGAERWQKQR